MARYLATVRATAKQFLGITIQAIPRGNNEAADKLVKMASSKEQPPLEVFYEVIQVPSAAPATQGAAPKVGRPARTACHQRSRLRDTVTEYLAGVEPEDMTEAERLRHRARNYRMVRGQLYKGGACSPFLRCVSRQEGQSLLQEIHEGSCDTHQAPKSPVQRHCSPSTPPSGRKQSPSWSRGGHGHRASAKGVNMPTSSLLQRNKGRHPSRLRTMIVVGLGSWHQNFPDAVKALQRGIHLDKGMLPGRWHDAELDHDALQGLHRLPDRLRHGG